MPDTTPEGLRNQDHSDPRVWSRYGPDPEYDRALEAQRGLAAMRFGFLGYSDAAGVVSEDFYLRPWGALPSYTYGQRHYDRPRKARE